MAYLIQLDNTVISRVKNLGIFGVYNQTFVTDMYPVHTYMRTSLALDSSTSNNMLHSKLHYPQLIHNQRHDTPFHLSVFEKSDVENLFLQLNHRFLCLNYCNIF